MGVHRGPCCLPRSPGGKDPSRPLTLRTSTKGPSDTNHADIPQLAAKGGRDQATCDSCAERRLSVLFTLLLLGLPDPLYLSQIPYEDGPCEKVRGLQHSWEKRSPAPSTTPRPGGSLGSKHSGNGATPAPGPGPSPATSESLPSPGTYAPRAAPENHMRVLGGLRVPPPARCSRWYLPPLSSGFCLAEPRRGWGAPRHPAWPPPKQGVPPFELRGRSCRCWERHWEHRKRKLFGRQSLAPRGVPVGGTGRDVTETQGHEDRVHRPRGIPLVGPLGARERVQGRMGPER